MTLKNGALTVSREEAHFDRACDQARRMAVSQAEIDSDGYSTIENWDRTDSSLVVRFVEYYNINGSHFYAFTWEAIKEEDG